MWLEMSRLEIGVGGGGAIFSPRLAFPDKNDKFRGNWLRCALNKSGQSKNAVQYIFYQLN